MTSARMPLIKWKDGCLPLATSFGHSFFTCSLWLESESHEKVSKRLKRGSLDLALGSRGRAKKDLDLCLFRGMDQSKGSAAIDTYPINQKSNRSRPKLSERLRYKNIVTQKTRLGSRI